MSDDPAPLPLIMPLGDHGLLMRFATTLSEAANRRAVGFVAKVEAARLPGVVEVVPNLASVLIRYVPSIVEFERLAGEVRLLVAGPEADAVDGRVHSVTVEFAGEDLDEVAAIVGVSRSAFVAMHCAQPLRVLATGFAPGFVYLGFHAEALRVPRRAAVRSRVPAGTVLFAAGQTAITSTDIPTGWHVIGRTAFRNFDPSVAPPTRLAAGDMVRFEVAG
ncbi:MAG: carboxyltransferase domain-containing protein [Devosia sp.]|nr:carboxyltransferase domain-containing protein [Devosia sp.]